MLDDLLRPLKDRLLDPLARLVGRRLSPSALTIAAFLCGGACAALLWLGFDGAALGVWILNRLLDGLDGLVARRTGRTSDFGGYLDIVLDFVVYAMVPLGMTLASPSLALPCALFLGAAYINSATWMFLAALLEKRGRGAAASGAPTSVVMPAGIVEGTETIVLFTLMIAIPALRSVILFAGAALILLGAALRFYQGARLLRRPSSASNGTS